MGQEFARAAPCFLGDACGELFESFRSSPRGRPRLRVRHVGAIGAFGSPYTSDKRPPHSAKILVGPATRALSSLCITLVRDVK